MKRFFVILFAVVLLAPEMAFAYSDCYLSSGYGTAVANGDYVRTTNANGDTDSWTNGSSWIYHASGHYWVMDSVDTSVTGLVGLDKRWYYLNYDVPFPTDAWTIGDGDSPAGNVISETCPTPPPATTTTATTSSEVANFQEWLFGLCVVIFFLSMMTWGIIFRPIYKILE